MLKSHGFNINRRKVVKAVKDPDRVDIRGEQYLALKILDDTHALRVVTKRETDII